MRLFEDFPRTRATYKGEKETDYDFLNTSGFRFVEQVRQYTQEWFDRYPEEAKTDLRGRFVSDDDQQHTSSHFELFLHEILLRLGFSVEVHPTIMGISEHPDFLATRGTQSFYLEAVVVHSNSEDRTVTSLERDVRKWIKEIDSPDFSFWLRARGVLSTQPKKRDFQPILKLLADHNPDDVQAAINEYGVSAAPHTWIQVGTWYLRVTLMPRPLHFRGDHASGNIAGGPGSGGRPKTSTVAKRIENKATQKQSSKLDAPLLIAAKTMDTIYQIRDCAVPTLLGRLEPTHPYDPNLVAPRVQRQSPGVWVGRNGKSRYHNLQAVWLFEAMPTVAPTPTAELSSTMVFNPTTEIELPSALHVLPHMRAQSGRMETVKGIDLNRLLGVEPLDPARWEDVPTAHE